MTNNFHGLKYLQQVPLFYPIVAHQYYQKPCSSTTSYYDVVDISKLPDPIYSNNYNQIILPEKYHPKYGENVRLINSEEFLKISNGTEEFLCNVIRNSNRDGIYEVTIKNEDCMMAFIINEKIRSSKKFPRDDSHGLHGIIAEVAFAKIFGLGVSTVSLDEGDCVDFKYNRWLLDTKTTDLKGKSAGKTCKFIPAAYSGRDEFNNSVPVQMYKLETDIFIFSFFDQLSEGGYKVYFYGWAFRNDVINTQPIETNINGCSLVYEVAYDKPIFHPIKELSEYIEVAKSNRTLELVKEWVVGNLNVEDKKYLGTKPARFDIIKDEHGMFSRR